MIRFWLERDELIIVPKTYSAEDMLRYEPAPPQPSHPNTPGDMGTIQIDPNCDSSGSCNCRYIRKTRFGTFEFIGAAVVIPPEREEESKTRFPDHYYDVVANELMPFNRTIDDARYEE